MWMRKWLQGLFAATLVVFGSIVLLELAYGRVVLAARSLELPPRSARAPTGTEFIAKTKSMSAQAREDAIFAEIRRGNIPSFLRKLVPVHVDAGGRKGTIWVMPDYMAIGSDSDFVRIPMTPITAQKLADVLGAVIPTPKLVDTIYRQAQVKLAPQPLPYGKAMVTSEYYLKHQNAIERQRGNRPKTLLVAGQKKDVVLTNRLVRQPSRVAIYGWHRKNGKAIQPLSLVHDNKYADYSHGVRFIAATMEVNGREVRVEDVLKNGQQAQMLSYEGRMYTTTLVPDRSASRRYIAANSPSKQPKKAGGSKAKVSGMTLASGKHQKGSLPKIQGSGKGSVRGGAAISTAKYQPRAKPKAAPHKAAPKAKKSRYKAR